MPGLTQGGETGEEASHGEGVAGWGSDSGSFWDVQQPGPGLSRNRRVTKQRRRSSATAALAVHAASHGHVLFSSSSSSSTSSSTFPLPAAWTGPAELAGAERPRLASSARPGGPQSGSRGLPPTQADIAAAAAASPPGCRTCTGPGDARREVVDNSGQRGLEKEAIPGRTLRETQARRPEPRQTSAERISLGRAWR